MSSAAALRKDTFASLSNPNYRRYYAGQAVSNIGTWMQTIGQSWLVLELTGSATAIGALVAFQSLPVLVLGPYGGVVADRADKRKLLMGLMAGKGLLALVLGLLTVTHNVELWMVFVLAGLLGLNNCFENPTRQAFVLEMVGPEHLRNAVSLNSVLINVARAIGPAAAGMIIATGGIGLCFLINAATFIGPLFSLATLDKSKLQPSPPSGRGRGQLREGIAYARRTPAIAVPLVMMAIIGCLAYEFQVVLPIVAKESFNGGASTYGFMTATMGIGAVAGGLWIAARGRTGVKALTQASVLFGVAIMAAAVAPTLPLELVALLLVGATSVQCLSQGSSTIQLAAAPMMRGRIMALWAVAVMGSTPIGGPAAGAVSQYFGARSGLVLGSVACFVAAAIGALALSSQTKQAALEAADPVGRKGDLERVGALVAEPSEVRMIQRTELPLPASANAAYISGDVKIAGGPAGPA
jgi:MFS family permease